MKSVFDVLVILVSALMLGAILLQNRSSGLGSAFGQQTTVFRTRRGIERLLFRATIGMAVVFVLVSVASVREHTLTASVTDVSNTVPPGLLPTAVPNDATSPEPASTAAASAAPAATAVP